MQLLCVCRSCLSSDFSFSSLIPQRYSNYLHCIHSPNYVTKIHFKPHCLNPSVPHSHMQNNGQPPLRRTLCHPFSHHFPYYVHQNPLLANSSYTVLFIIPLPPFTSSPFSGSSTHPSSISFVYLGNSYIRLGSGLIPKAFLTLLFASLPSSHWFKYFLWILQCLSLSSFSTQYVHLDL